MSEAWRISHNLEHYFGNQDGIRVRRLLEGHGFRVAEDMDNGFYLAQPPVSWCKVDQGFWTEFFDASGVRQLGQWNDPDDPNSFSFVFVCNRRGQL